MSPRSTAHKILARTIAATMFLMGAVPVLQHACGHLAGYHHEISCCCADEGAMRDHHAQAAACDHEASDELPGRLIVEADNPSDGCCHIATMASEEEATTVAVKPPVRVLHPAMLDFATEWHHDATASSAEADARLVGPQNRPLHLLNAVFLR